jgi:hypothetical protein
MTDESGAARTSEVAHILRGVTEEVGVRIFDEWTSADSYLFRGPHGRLEHFGYSEDLGHWKRGPYCRVGVLRDRLAKAARGHSQWSGWRLIRRDELGGAEPVVVDDVSTPVRCTLCHERFESGNAFGWHLADVHQEDTDDKSRYCVEVLEDQHTLGRFSGGGRHA